MMLQPSNWLLFKKSHLVNSKNKLKFVDYVSDNDLLAKNNVCIKTPAQPNIEY